jgi:hypothetical protein
MSCVSSMTLLVLINGFASPFFRPGRGLRQGCPLSLLHLIIVVEGLSRVLMEAKRSSTFKGL